MRIAIGTPVFPFPPDSGSRIRIVQIVRALKRRHQLAILSLETGDARTAASVLGIPITCYAVRTTRGLGPFNFDATTPRGLWKFAAEWRAEAVHLEKTFTAAAAGLPRMSPPLPVILDEGCVHHVSYRRQAESANTVAAKTQALLRYWRLKRFERQLAPVPYALIAVSEEEAALLRRLAPAARVVVAPNGVDTDVVHPSPPGDAILFVGLMSYAPNRDAVRYFVKEILSRLSNSSGGPEFFVAGRDPGPEIEELARRDDRIRLLGFVPDLQPLYARAAVFVNPMRGGGGTRLKVLEAMAAGKAVVSTTIGAEGLAVTPGRDILLADAPATFAATIQDLLTDRKRASEIGEAGRELVESRYRWEHCLEPLEAVYEELLLHDGHARA